MTIFVAPLFVLLVAIGFSARIVFLKSKHREVSRSLGSARYAAWSAAGFSLALALLQSGLLPNL